MKASCVPMASAVLCLAVMSSTTNLARADEQNASVACCQKPQAVAVVTEVGGSASHHPHVASIVLKLGDAIANTCCEGVQNVTLVGLANPATSGVAPIVVILSQANHPEGCCLAEAGNAHAHAIQLPACCGAKHNDVIRTAQTAGFLRVNGAAQRVRVQLADATSCCAGTCACACCGPDTACCTVATASPEAGRVVPAGDVTTPVCCSDGCACACCADCCAAGALSDEPVAKTETAPTVGTSAK